MDRGIKGRKALVNGGSAGLGKSSARALAAEAHFGAIAIEQGTTSEQVVQDCINEWRIPANRFDQHRSRSQR